MIRGKHLTGFDVERHGRALSLAHRIINTALQPIVRSADRAVRLADGVAVAADVRTAA